MKQLLITLLAIGFTSMGYSQLTSEDVAALTDEAKAALLVEYNAYVEAQGTNAVLGALAWYNAKMKEDYIAKSEAKADAELVKERNQKIIAGWSSMSRQQRKACLLIYDKWPYLTTQQKQTFADALNNAEPPAPEPIGE